MAVDVTGDVDLSFLVNGQDADAADVTIPFYDVIGLINDILNGVQAADEVAVDGDILLGGATEGGINARTVDMFTTPDEHFESSAGALGSWAGAPFVGTPTTSSFATYDSMWTMRAGTNIADRAFAYESVSVGSASSFELSARLCLGPFNRISGIRIDDGTDSNYVELGLKTESKTNGLADLVYVTRVGAGTRTETVLLSNVLVAQFFSVRLALAPDTNVYMYYKLNIPFWNYLGTGLARSFTTTRVGLIQTVSANSGDAVGIFDWYKSG